VSPPIPTTKTNILNALVTQSHFSSPTWHDTWYGHHHPRRRILLLFLSYFISFNLSSWLFSWDKIGHNFKRLEDCATDVYDVFRGVEFECEVERSGVEAHVVEWSIPDDFESSISSMPASCLEIVQFGSNLRHNGFSENEEGEHPSQELTLPDNYTWLTFEFLDRSRHSRRSSSYSADDKAILTFTSSCKIRIDVSALNWETQEFSLIDSKDQEGSRKIINIEEIAQEVAINLSPVYYWLVHHLFLTVQLIIGSYALFNSLATCFIVMIQALKVVLLIRWFLPSSKDCIEWKYLTFTNTYWSLVLLILTVNIDLVSGSIFAIISAIVYRNRQAAIEWTFLIGVWCTTSIWEPYLVSLFEETLPLFDGLGIFKFVVKILRVLIPSIGKSSVCSRVLWVYAFVQSYPGRLPSFLNVFMLKKKAVEDSIQNDTDSNLVNARLKQE